ncbi:MAG: 16S rRNA (cytosine(967)-C(5))-methyltransferase RsmB, partial [Burkholderiales bacterium]
NNRKQLNSPPLSHTFAAASRVVARVLGGASLTAVLDEDAGGASRPAVQDLAYGTLRDYGAPEAILAALARKPIPDRAVHALLLCALHALRRERRAPHTIVDEAVTACAELGHAAARGFVNALLRNYLRRREALEAEARGSEAARFGYPAWWIERVRRAHPQAWEAVLAAGNRRPAMTLRVNRRKLAVEAWLAKLAALGIDARRVGEVAVRLAQPCGVERLPGFSAGEVSVQDAGAQLAAPLLEVRDGMRVLDACAAPGGKTAHLLELAELELLALDRDAERVPRIGATLERLGLTAEVRAADAGDPDRWWDGTPFDRVLLDVPCSASGVVRRHPDVKWLRREADLDRFAREQSRLLAALWQVLVPGGKLLYATCSVFPEENGAVIDAFLARHDDARRRPLPGLGDGQLRPDDEHDGFFYARLEKR